MKLWWKRKREKPDIEIIRKDIPVTDIARWFIYDTGVGDPTEMANVLGMNPDSEEGQEKQEQDSEARLSQISYLMPFIDLMADIVADSITGVQIQKIKEENPDDVEEIERESTSMHMMYKVLGMTSIIGAFSAAMEIGLISDGEISFAEEHLMEDDNE